MSGAFTTGPWKYGHMGDAERYWIGPDWDHTPVAFADRELPEANARLIAAAPELYEALRLFVDDERFQVTMGGNPNVVDRAIEQAHAALRKARGEA